MDRTERFYRIKNLLASRRAVPRQVFLDDLGVSLATFKRDLEYLRDRFQAPIIYDESLRGYRLDDSGDDIDLPGVWFSAQEIYALLTMHQLLDDIGQSLLDDKIAPLKRRVEALLNRGGHSQQALQQRVKIIHLGQKPLQPECFQAVCDALLSRKKVELIHYHRERDEHTRRCVSPLRVVYYRDNWYLDAWCHVRNGLRCFAMSAIREVNLLDEVAQDCDAQLIDDSVGAGYGIFSGNNVQWATLRFTPQRARWVAEEQWHPQQQAVTDAQGYYVLSVPYSDERELIMDILKHGAEVEVVAPASLRASMQDQLKKALEKYR